MFCEKNPPKTQAALQNQQMGPRGGVGWGAALNPGIARANCDVIGVPLVHPRQPEVGGRKGGGSNLKGQDLTGSVECFFTSYQPSSLRGVGNKEVFDTRGTVSHWAGSLTYGPSKCH